MLTGAFFLQLEAHAPNYRFGKECPKILPPSHFLARHEDEADRRMMMRLREKASQLNSELRMLKIAEAAGERGIQMKSANLSNMVGHRVGFGVWSFARGEGR